MEELGGSNLEALLKFQPSPLSLKLHSWQKQTDPEAYCTSPELNNFRDLETQYPSVFGCTTPQTRQRTEHLFSPLTCGTHDRETSPEVQLCLPKKPPQLLDPDELALIGNPVKPIQNQDQYKRQEQANPTPVEQYYKDNPRAKNYTV